MIIDIVTFLDELFAFDGIIMQLNYNIMDRGLHNWISAKVVCLGEFQFVKIIFKILVWIFNIRRRENECSFSI